MHKFHISRYKKYIFIIFLTFILLVITFSKSFSQENIFVVDNIKVKGIIDSNFSRDKYINKAFLNSFELLKSRILLSKDLDKINNVKLKEIRELIKSFQILNEIRHLAWDMGYGFDLMISRITGILTIIGSFVFTILFYLIGKNLF